MFGTYVRAFVSSSSDLQASARVQKLEYHGHAYTFACKNLALSQRHKNSIHFTNDAHRTVAAFDVFVSRVNSKPRDKVSGATWTYEARTGRGVCIGCKGPPGSFSLSLSLSG